MPEKRTTVIAREEDLATLAHEARSRDLPLGRLLGEVVAERANQLRRDRRPRLATFRSTTGIADAIDRDRPEARSFRS